MLSFNTARTLKKFEILKNTKKAEFKNDYDYIDYALSILESKCSTPFEVIGNDLESKHGEIKSSAEAENLRCVGNQFFTKKLYFEALRCYTRSITMADTGSSELAFAYANRSAVLLEKQYYKECLEDIERALENNYPEEKKAKLLSRQRKATELLPTQRKVLFHEEVPTIRNKNPNMPAASRCLKISKNEEYGRHIVATRPINAGEILLVEEPYSRIVFPEHRHIHCSHCLEFCFNMIPCEKCSAVLYCSRACRRMAYVDYHRYECAILRHFGYDLVNCNATRMTVRAVQEYGRKYTDSDIYRSDRYKELSELMLRRTRELEFPLLIKIIGAAKVFHVLKNYTDILSVLDIEDKENVLKSWLMKNVWIDELNAVNILVRAEDSYLHAGRGTYSALSIFNHACSENVGHSFFGSTVVARALKEIKEGEQCFINYGAYPCDDTTYVRQLFLQDNYSFACKCEACADNWLTKPLCMPMTVADLKSQMIPIFSEILNTPNIDKPRKRTLLKKSIEILRKSDKTLPLWTYDMRKKIFPKIMLEGNIYSPF